MNISHLNEICRAKEIKANVSGKRLLCFILILLSFSSLRTASAQNENDSLLRVINAPRHDTDRIMALNELAFEYVWNDPKKALDYALPARALAQKIKYNAGERNALFIIGEALAVSGNYDKALEVKFKGLQLSEKSGEQKAIGQGYMNLAATYYYQGDYPLSIKYSRRAIAITPFYNQSKLQLNGFLAEAFFHLHQLDSALVYAQKAYEIDMARDGEHWSVPYFILAGIHQAQKHYDLALQYFKLGLEGNQPKKDVVDGHLGIAKLFFEKGNRDSALHYTRKAINEGQQFSFQAEVAEAAELATRIFKLQNNSDSTLAYQTLMIAAKDSLFSQEKMRAVQNLTFDEQLREQEIESKKMQEHEERKRSLQFVFIGLGITTFLIIFFLFSHSVVANEKLIKFLGILALLMVFEFINLFIDPYIDQVTDHSLPLKLGAMILIAGLLIPVHSRLEHWVNYKLVEKNKRIRLDAAKKTIAELEGEQATG